ncbi:MAG: tetratricopeptide repeat protein, partial [Gammaproteobacteria bacterium]|nr:tetratricopeptide repeat protein [Gammaproteobacteria bacterium]
MILKRVFLLLMFLLLTSCAFDGNQGTIAELEAVQIELKDADVDDGLDKAMQGYQKFLAETPESQLTPEALRRLADLKIEKEYGIVTDDSVLDEEKPSSSTPAEAEVSTNAVSTIQQQGAVEKDMGKAGGLPAIAGKKETEKDFEKRATGDQQIKSASSNKNIQLPKGEAGADLQNAGAEEAIRLYRKLLDKYPTYERNDQVLYQLSRAYEEVGKVDEAMNVMNRLVKKFPRSRYTDEVQFRRGEYYFTRKKYLDAEDAYGEVLKMGVGTVYYERALYKKGWAFYKQELYEEALKEFFELLDYKVSIGYDFEQTSNNIERKRIGDTLRVVSLSFSNLGGAASVQEFFTRTGARDYEYNIYGELAEFFFEKRRYNDAATTYNTFIESNPFHKKSPHYSMRVIDIYLKGRFPKLVIEAKKQFASTYGLEAEYWGYFDQAEYPEVLGFLKTNISDLANHFHSLYQNKKYRKKKHENYVEASHWYKEFLKSFPKDEQSPGINYQLADLYLENKDFKLAAIEFERSAYDYPVNDKSQKAAYAAIYSYREHLKKAPVSQIKNIKREIIRTTLRLVDTYPSHEKATVVLGAATDDLFEMRDFTLGIKVGRRLIEEYPKADSKITRGAWLVVAHSSYEIEIFNDAEMAYQKVLRLTATDDKTRVQLIDNLAASIYKQGEQARTAEDYKEAVRHFLRIADVAPLSTIRPTAEYDAAAVLLQVRDLEQAVSVLLSFRSNYPDHKLQKDVTRKVAFAYKELEKFTLAAREYERIAVEADTEDLVREAMLEAAELYEKAKDVDNSLRVYKRFVVMFPKPLEFALETYYKIALIHKTQGELKNYRDTLQHIIDTDKKAGGERTDRTRYLAAQSSLIIIEPNFDNYIAIKLVKPFKRSLKNKQKSMKSLVKKYTSLVDYQVADVTAASTYYIAEIYFNFNRSLMESEKPDKLSEVELEEFNLMVEEQAFPFEEKAIQVHEKNIELLSRGIYSKWIDRSIDKLAMLIPARYGKSEETISFISKIDNYIYNSPRYAREDASTGILNNLFVFRYVSQKLQSELHKTRSDGDIDSDGSVNQVNIGVEVPENTSDSVRDSKEVPSSQKAGPEETSAQTQTSGSELNGSELNDSELNRSPEAENTSGDVGKEKTESETEQDTQVATDTQLTTDTQESLGENSNQITGNENVSNDSQMESSTKNSEEVVQSEVEVEGQVEGQ